jgi:hypothetical protein
MAHRAAAINGDSAPAWITAVVTTHAKALTSATPGDYLPGSGHTQVSLVIDARTFRGLDFGISPGPPPVLPGSLGPLTYLSGRGH